MPTSTASRTPSTPVLHRKQLFAAAQQRSNADSLRFLHDVFRCVMDRRDGDLLRLLRRPGAAIMLREGFQANSSGTERASFAQLCVNADNLAGLRAALAAGIPGITLRDCSKVVRSSQGVTVTSEFDLPASSIERLDAESLSLAIEFDPSHESFTKLSGPQLTTLHYSALAAALQGGSRDRVEAAARCCSIFVANAAIAPCECDVFGKSALSRVFVTGAWDRKGYADVVLPLLGEYVAAGLFDLDAPMEISSATGERCVPLAAAIQYGNVALSGALIDLGCDLDAARGGFADTLALAESRIGVNPRCVETRSAVAEALMRRRLKAVPAEPTAPSPQAMATPGRRIRVL